MGAENAVMDKRPVLQPRKQIATFLVFVCFFAVLLIPIKTPLNRYDEGFAVFGAARVLRGDLPYKDFWTIYPPGQFYATSFFFMLFGEDLLVSRILDTLIRLGITVAIYLLAKKTVSHGLALLGCGATVVLLASAGFYSYAVFPALALALFSLLSLMKYLDAHQLRYLFLAGMLMGCASLFRWDIALYAGITAILVLCIVQSNEISKKNQKTGVYTHISSIFALSALLLAGALLVALPVYGYLASKTGFDNLWAQMIVFPTTQLHNYRWIPYPAVIPQRDEYGSLHLGEWLRFYLPAVTYALALLTVLYALLRKRAVFGIRQFGQVVIVVFGALLFVQALSRYDYIHVVPTSLVVFIVILTLLEDYLRSTRNAQIKYVLLVPVLVLFAVYFFPPIKRLATYVTEYSPLKCHSSLEKARCIYLSFDQQQAVQYIQRHTKQNETIFVGNQRHDLIFVNDISFYFLSDRVSATSYHELYPGVATTLSVQTMIVNEIETKNVDWLVLVDMGESNEPNASSTSSGVHYLDDHIRTKFSPLYRIDAYDIWRRANN